MITQEKFDRYKEDCLMSQEGDLHSEYCILRERLCNRRCEYVEDCPLIFWINKMEAI